jgi:hypothetical protein
VRKLPENVSKGALDLAVSNGRLLWNGLRDSLTDSGDYGDEESAGAAILGDKQFTAQVAPAPDPKGLTPEQLRATSDQRAAHQAEQAALPVPLDDQWGEAYDMWRAELGSDDSLGDHFTQGIAQFAIPFTAYSKAFGVASAPSAFGMFGRALAAESATVYTSFDPHGGRFADLVELGKESEGRLGTVLNTLSPDGSLLNQYFDWQTDRAGESDTEGRFKNTLDNLVPSVAAAGIIKAASSTFKAARTLVRPEPAPAAPAPPKPLAPIETETGFAVEHPTGTLEFGTPEDATAHIDEVKNMMGGDYEARAAAEHAKASDKNFATLHSFAKVLQSNLDRPTSTHSLVSAMEQNIKGDTESGAFYKELLGRLKAKKLGGMTTVTAEAGPSATARGGYSPGANAVKLYPNAFTAGPEKLLHTFTHEVVHAATVNELRQSPKAAAKISALFKKVQESFNEKLAAESAVPGAAPAKKHYGFVDPEEFIAEIESNPTFRKLMKDTKIDGESAWDKYKKAIGGILGIGGLVMNPEFDKLMDPQETPIA